MTAGEKQEIGQMPQESEDCMKVEEGSIYFPTPNDSAIANFEKRWRIVLPKDYKTFLQKYNLAIPIAKSFDYLGHGYFVVRFCGMIEEIKKARKEESDFDIDVIDAQLDDRLSEDRHSNETALMPIAELFAGDLLCMDFRNGSSNPTICIWYHEDSGYFSPSTGTIANTFSEFLSMLYEEE